MTPWFKSLTPSLGVALAFVAGCNPVTQSKLQNPNPAAVVTVSDPPETQPTLILSNKPKLIVEVSGFANQQGHCRIALYRNSDGFNQPDQAWSKVTLELPEKGPSVWTVELDSQALADPQTRWAISAHHDKNKNDKLDKNAFGIPVEPYGFSNNPKRGFGPPKFDEVSFSIDQSQPENAKRIEIQIH